jgi:hypothetical protein
MRGSERERANKNILGEGVGKIERDIQENE